EFPKRGMDACTFESIRRYLVTALLAMLLLAPSAYADLTPINGSVTMNGEAGDWVSQGHDFLFDQGVQITLRGDEVQVVTPTPPGAAFGYTFLFSSPTGQHLQTGVYDNAERFED